MRSAAPASAPIAEQDDAIIFSIRLKSGRFESTIQCPLSVSDDERQAFVEAWFKMMEAGIKCGRRDEPKTRPPP